jgi:hypothetical protein
MLASRVEVAIADGVYELVPEIKEGQQEGDLNTVIIDQEISESEAVEEQEGKHRSIN